LAHQFPAEGHSATLLQIAAAASRGESGDPMDAAILEAVAEHPQIEPVASFPFTEDRKHETNLFRQGGTLQAAVKGAPETVLALGAEDAATRQQWLDRVAELASTGHKVIACAHRVLPADHAVDTEPD